MRDLSKSGADLAHLTNTMLGASEIVTGLSYEECCTARQLVRELQLKVLRAVAERYDATDERGFADLVKVALGLLPDQREAARRLGASVSSINRWKSGSTIPHRLVRVSIKAAVLDLLDTNSRLMPEVPDVRSRVDERAVARTVTH